MARWLAFILACWTVVIGAMLIWATAAWPQACLPLGLAERGIAERRGEALFAVGQIQGRMMRLYANRETRSWTALSVDGRGTACVIGSGTDLEFVAPPKPGSPT